MRYAVCRVCRGNGLTYPQERMKNAAAPKIDYAVQRMGSGPFYGLCHSMSSSNMPLSSRRLVFLEGTQKPRREKSHVQKQNMAMAANHPKRIGRKDSWDLWVVCTHMIHCHLRADDRYPPWRSRSPDRIICGSETLRTETHLSENH